MKYEEFRARAQKEANEAARLNPEYAARRGCEWGIWKNAFGEFTMMRLPLPQNRAGMELQCDVVYPELLPVPAGYILWDQRNGDPPRDATTGEFMTSGHTGILTADSVYLTTYAQWPAGAPALHVLEVGQHISGVKFSLSGERGEYSVWRVR